MNRLTEFHSGIWGLSTEAVKEGYDIYSVYSRLAEYEDTGLTPQEINHYVAIHKELWEEKIASIQEALDLSKAEVQGLSKQVHELTKQCDYWEFEAKKWCDQTFELRKQTEEKGVNLCQENRA